MQLTIVVSSTQRRGAEVFASQLVDSLPQLGWSADFVALADRPPGAESRVPAVPLSDRGPASLGRLDPGVVRSLRSRIREHDADLVLANGSSTLQYGVAAVRTMPKRPKLVYSSIGEPLYWARSLRQRLTYRLLLKLVDHVFSVSAGTAHQLTDHLGLPPARLSVVHGGVPSRFLSAGPSGRHDGPFRVLYAGSLSHEKDPLAAVEIAKRLARTTPVALRIAGAGPLESDVRAACSEPSLSDVVELVGSVPDVLPHLEWADALVLTSRTEGLPGIVLEAAASGTPVVAFDVGGVAETIEDGRTGVLVGSGDHEAAAAGLARLAAEDEFRISAGQAGRAMVEARFTMAHAVERYDRALRGVLGRGESR